MGTAQDPRSLKEGKRPWVRRMFLHLFQCLVHPQNFALCLRKDLSTVIFRNTCLQGVNKAFGSVDEMDRENGLDVRWAEIRKLTHTVMRMNYE
jgi:hypothetical protein